MFSFLYKKFYNSLYPSTSRSTLFYTIILLIISHFSICMGQLIPHFSEQEYSFVNHVSIRQQQLPSTNNENSRHQNVESTETTYRFFSKLKIKSVWHSKTNNEQLLEIYLTENEVSTHDKNGHERRQPINEIPVDRPFYVTLVDNRLDRLIAHTYRDESLLNIKRAVASLLQIQQSSEEVTSHETDISGECRIHYLRKSTNRLEKRKYDCTNWDLRIHYRPEKSLGVDLKSEQLIEYELSSDGRLLVANSRENHCMTLTANKELGNSVESTIVLKQIRTASDTKAEVEQRNHKSLDEAVDSLMDWYRVFELAADVDGEISDIKQDNTTLKELIASVVKELDDLSLGTETLAETFIRLLPKARLTKQAEFVDILENNPSSIQGQLIDLLGAVQTIEAHRAVHEIYQYDRKQDQDMLEKYLQSLAMGTHVDRLIIADLFERSKQKIKNIKLYDSVLQTLASLTSHYLNENNDDVLKSVRLYITDDLMKDCKNNDVPCVLRFLRALKNLKDPITLDILFENVIKGNDIKTATTAMDAITSFSIEQFTQTQRQYFTDIFYQLYRRYDSSVRLMALDMILQIKPIERQILQQLLQYLSTKDHHFEIKTYVIQKLRMLAERCVHFRRVLRSSLLEMKHINNYNIMAQKGLTTVLLRDLSWSTAFNESILSVQEIYKGVLKRGSVEMLLHTESERDQSTFKLGMFSNGLTGFVGDSDSSSKSDSDGDEDDGSVTAGMEIAIQGVYLRPLIFFNGHTELMGHVWSGTASEPTPAFQATLLDHDHEHYIILASGATVHMRVLTAKSMDLYGQVQFSLWNRNANTEIVHQCGVGIYGYMRAGITYAQVSSEFLMSYEPTLSLQANVDFYSGIKMCIQLQRPDLTKRYVGRRSVWLKTASPVQNYRKHWNFTSSLNVNGRTFVLNQKNNEMCNMIFN